MSNVGRLGITMRCGDTVRVGEATIRYVRFERDGKIHIFIEAPREIPILRGKAKRTTPAQT
jgi:hypothetical protein